MYFNSVSLLEFGLFFAPDLFCRLKACCYLYFCTLSPYYSWSLLILCCIIRAALHRFINGKGESLEATNPSTKVVTVVVVAHFWCTTFDWLRSWQERDAQLANKRYMHGEWREVALWVVLLSLTNPVTRDAASDRHDERMRNGMIKTDVFILRWPLCCLVILKNLLVSLRSSTGVYGSLTPLLIISSLIAEWDLETEILLLFHVCFSRPNVTGESVFSFRRNSPCIWQWINTRLEERKKSSSHLSVI